MFWFRHHLLTHQAIMCHLFLSFSNFHNDIFYGIRPLSVRGWTKIRSLWNPRKSSLEWLFHSKNTVLIHGIQVVNSHSLSPISLGKSLILFSGDMNYHILPFKKNYQLLNCPECGQTKNLSLVLHHDFSTDWEPL